MSIVSPAGAKGAARSGIGRSCGGFSTKIHLKTDFGGLPIAFHLTGGPRPYEQAVGKLKRIKRIALRCEKTAGNYSSSLALALGFILIKSVHTA